MGAYRYESKGKTYYLYHRGENYIFGRNPEALEEKGYEPVEEIPKGMTIVLNERSGLPLLKRSDGGEEGGPPGGRGAKKSEKDEDLRLPDELQELLDEGWAPRLKHGEWVLQKRIDDAVKSKYVSKKYWPVMEQIVRQRKEKEESDEEVARKIREGDEKELKTKPILAKQLEKMSWFENLIHDVGHYAYQKLQRDVEWTEEEVSNEYLAQKKICRLIDTLANLHDNPQLIIDLQMENGLLKTQLDIAEQGWMLEKILKKAALERGEVLVRHMDQDARAAAIKEFMARGILELTPEMVQRLAETEG